KTIEGSHRPRILIVEDEALIRAELASCLEKLGYTVCGAASTGERAVQLAETERPDLVMMDIVLQDKMDGIEAAQIIRNKWDIPVVFLTSYVDTDRLERAKLTYPFGYLLKPFQERDLKITLEMALYVGKVDAERRIAIAALERSEKKHRFLTDNTDDAIFTLDMNLKHMYVSPSIFKLRGFKASEVMAQNISEVLTPGSLSIATKIISEELLADGREGVDPHRTRNVELEVIRKDGTTVWTETKCSFQRDEDGKIVGILGVTRDITDRKKVEDALRESEQRFDQLAAHSRTIAWEVNTDGLYTFISDASKAVWGYRPEELVGRKHFYDLHPEEGREEFKSAAFAVFERKETFHNLINPVQTHDGRLVWVSTNGIPMQGQAGELLGYRGSDTDITERKKAEDALRASEERFSLAMEATRDGIWDWNLNTDEVYYSPGYVAMLGYTSSEIITRISAWSERIHPEDKNALIKTSMDCIENRCDNFEVEFRMQAKNGEWRWMLGRGKVALRDDSGRAVRIVGTHTDINRRKQAEEERERLIQELQVALNEVKTLRGFIPICASCKKIRNDEGYWEQIEEYISDRSEAQFSHGICPDCAKKYYPDLYS
ncbi:MAG: PAS domain S-box protein, partial [Deltaproteobacteria bacterium]|nr:PAS domain S-box protein [Deltaproteobacteria bacterium]